VSYDEDRDGDDVDERVTFDPSDWRKHHLVEEAMAPRGLPVSNTPELTRIVNLPRRPTVTKDSPTAEALIRIGMQKYSLGPRQCRCRELDPDRQCIQHLFWAQAWMLYEIELVGGLLAQAAVGIGKTLVNILTPLALRGCRLALLLIPPTLVKQLIDEYQMIAEHFRVPGIVVHLPGRKTWQCEPKPRPAHLGGGYEPTMHVLPYSRLSGIENSEWINNLLPDAIIADEVDALKDMESARTMRVMRYFEEHEATTRFCGWTGSLTDNSIREMAHLAALALRGDSPLPIKREVIDEWSQCLDAVPQPTPIGALKRLLEPHETEHDMRQAFRRRLSETPGFIMVEGRQTITTNDGREVEVEIRERKAPPIPSIIDEALAKVRQSCRPDSLVARGDEQYEVQDEILADPLEQAKCAREIACGFFYRWVFPKVRQEGPRLVVDNLYGKPQSHELISQWYAARKAWNSELRLKMLRGEANLDSPKLCENAARRAWGDLPTDPDMPEWKAENWPAWRDIMDKVLPQPEAQRLHSFLVDDAAKWAYEHQGIGNSGIIWYANIEFAQWVAERARELYGLEVPVHGGGPGAEEAILKERGDRTIIASIKSHGRGRNKLQYRFSIQLLAQMLASSRMMEQLLGRLHRRGQDRDSVITELYAHTDEVRSAFKQALLRAEYVEDVMGAGQKLIEGWQGFESHIVH
jgi:hypothetical protein